MVGLSGSSINTNYLNVDKEGHVSFSGLKSNIDWKTVVDNVMKVKQITVDRVDRDISLLDLKIKALQNLEEKLINFQNALSLLYGAVSADNSKDVFESKFANVSVSGVNPSSASTLLGSTVSNSAALGKYDLVISNLATSHKLRSQSMAFSASASLNLSGTINFKSSDAGAVVGTINVGTSDTLSTIASLINNGNFGVKASVISVSPTSSYLILNATQTGTPIYLDQTSTLGLLDASGLGLTDGTITGASYTINAGNVLSPSNSASLSIESIPVVRTSNLISDLISGVTLQLLKAEPTTTISFEVAQDSGMIKKTIESFVSAYNDLRQEVNIQSQFDSEKNKPAETAVLYGVPAIFNVQQLLNFASASIALGNNLSFASLSQIGITPYFDFDNLSSTQSSLATGTLTLDDDVLSAALLNNMDGVRKLFSFVFTSSNPNIVMVGFDENTSYMAQGFTLDVTSDGTNLTGVTTSEGTVSFSGNTIRFETGKAKGLNLFYAGTSNASGINISYSLGIASQLNGQAEQLLDQDTGIIINEINGMMQKSDLYKTRSDEMKSRLDQRRDLLMEQYRRMETKMAHFNTVSDSIKQTVDSWFGRR